MPNEILKKNTNMNKRTQGANNAFLIKPEEILVKIENGSIVVRTAEGKLIRRKDSDGILDKRIELIKPDEKFVRIEDGAVVVRNTDGKLVRRRVNQLKAAPQKNKQEDKTDKEEPSKTRIGAINPALKVVRVNSEKQKEVTKEPIQKENGAENETGSLRDRLKSRHAFLSRIERGEKVSQPQELPQMDESTFTPNNDFVEDIESEDVGVDASVTALEDATVEEKYNRTVGNMSSQAMRGVGSGSISGSAKNPNEKPLMGSNSKMSRSLAGNNDYVLAKPEKEIVVTPKKVKKARKPINQTAFVLSLVGVYAIGLLIYFLIGYNFKPKKVDLILYYITIGNDAKLNYYDGEKINTTDMLMTFYYSEDDIKQSSLTESNIAEPAVGMGYGIQSNGYISAIWTGDYANKDSRDIKLKFDYDGLICYVPVTIYRNKLDKLVKKFNIPSLSVGQEINPTIYGVYTNAVIAESGETKQRELDHNVYTLLLVYEGINYNLKEIGCYNNGVYTMPEEYNEIEFDYSKTGTRLVALYHADGYNAEKSLNLYVA